MVVETDVCVSTQELDRLGAKLDPKLKDWIDRVIVPGMVRQYIERRSPSESSSTVAHSVSDELSAEVSE
jgi:hypothetical protein